jgi:replicative DNA helicase
MSEPVEPPAICVSSCSRGPGRMEQDADVGILLNRPDAFERDDPRRGEADFTLAKHRNGPTKTVTVAHQLHLSRFTNMAR